MNSFGLRFIAFVFVLAVLFGAINANRLYESHVTTTATGREPVQPEPYKAVSSIYVWHQPLKDMPVGAQGCYEVFYTSSGEPFVWAWEDSDPICHTIVRRDKDGWHATQQGPTDHEQITGYVSVRQAEGIPIS